MKFYTNMPIGLKSYYKKELGFYQIAIEKKEFVIAWQHLENAHVLGQAYPMEHTAVHWLMLKFGFKIKNIKEIVGQMPRLFFGGIKSFVGKIPVGNTGGSNVSALKPINISPHLKTILDKYQNE